MIIDGALQFTGTAGVAGSPDTPTTGTQQSTNVIDLAVARDLGIGDDPALKLLIQILTTFTGGTSLDVQLQGFSESLAPVNRFIALVNALGQLAGLGEGKAEQHGEQ